MKGLLLLGHSNKIWRGI